MFSELNSSDKFFDANAFDYRTTVLPFLDMFFFRFSDPTGCESLPTRTLVTVSCQKGDIGSNNVRGGLTPRRAASLTCCVSQKANHNRECCSKEKGSVQNMRP